MHELGYYKKLIVKTECYGVQTYKHLSLASNFFLSKPDKNQENEIEVGVF